MATAIKSPISSIPNSSQQLTTSMPYSIPMEIILQFDPVTSTGSSDDSDVISHYREATDIPNSQTVFADNNIAESSFNGGVISLSSDGDSPHEIPVMLPLDYRLGLSIANDNLRHRIPQNEGIFINNAACMDMDSLCGAPNEWEMESICGDSIETEEDVTSISE